MTAELLPRGFTILSPLLANEGKLSAKSQQPLAAYALQTVV